MPFNFKDTKIFFIQVNYQRDKIYIVYLVFDFLTAEAKQSTTLSI